MSVWKDVILASLQGIVQQAVNIVPKVIAGLVLLLLGWLVARLLHSVVSRVLRRLGFDRLAERSGITSLMASSGFRREPSWVVGRLIFWLLLLTFFLAAANQLELDAIVSTLQNFVGFIPNLVAVVLIGVFGAVFGRFVEGLVRASASEAGIEFADLLGKLVTNVILIMVVVMAFSQLEIKSDILEVAFGVILGAFGLGIAIMLGFGSKDVARNIIAGLYARRQFHAGQPMRVGEFEGHLQEVGTVSTTIQGERGEALSVANERLLREVVTRRDSAGDEVVARPV